MFQISIASSVAKKQHRETDNMQHLSTPNSMILICHYICSPEAELNHKQISMPKDKY